MSRMYSSINFPIFSGFIASGLGPAASKSSPGSDTETKSLGNAFAATSPSRIFFKVSSGHGRISRWTFDALPDSLPSCDSAVSSSTKLQLPPGEQKLSSTARPMAGTFESCKSGRAASFTAALSPNRSVGTTGAMLSSLSFSCHGPEPSKRRSLDLISHFGPCQKNKGSLKWAISNSLSCRSKLAASTMRSFCGCAATALRIADRAVSKSRPTDWWTKLYASRGPTSPLEIRRPSSSKILCSILCTSCSAASAAAAE
mmetsp:Transcript_12256/g.20185  ORF Transcript_12256/g.20185 Transcript_12256/m.20185 type:complete len:257 (+) Transcript_12256:1320-2090(+)